MKLKHVVIGSAAILAVVAAVGVGETQVAKRHAWGIGGPFGHHLMGLAWKLDLNDAQRQQVKSLIAAERPDAATPHPAAGNGAPADGNGIGQRPVR